MSVLETAPEPLGPSTSRKTISHEPQVAEEIRIGVWMNCYRRHLVAAIRLFKDRVIDVRVAKQLFPTQ